MKLSRKTCLTSFVAVAIFIIVYVWIRFIISDRMYPFVFGDETIHSYKAYLWNRYHSWSAPSGVPDVESQYAPLYSIVTSFLYSGKDLVDAYPMVLRFNAFLLSIACCALFLLLKTKFSAYVSAIVSCCTGLYAGYAGCAVVSMSEALFLPLFVLLVAVIIVPRESVVFQTILCTILLFLLLLTRKQGIGLLPAIPLSIVLTYKNHRIKAVLWSILPFIIGCLAWKIDGLCTSGGHQNLQWYSKAFFALSPETKLSLQPIWGQIAYMNAASGCLLVPAILLALFGPRKIRIPSQILLILCVFFIIPGIIHMYTHNSPTADSRYQMYGRYCDGAVIIISILGILSLFQSYHFRDKYSVAQIVILTSLLLSLFIPIDIKGPYNLNFGACWILLVEKLFQIHFVRYVLIFIISSCIAMTYSSNSTRCKYVALVSFIIVQLLSTLYFRTRISADQTARIRYTSTVRRLRESKDAILCFSGKEETGESYVARFFLCERFYSDIPSDLSGDIYILDVSGKIDKLVGGDKPLSAPNEKKPAKAVIHNP